MILQKSNFNLILFSLNVKIQEPIKSLRLSFKIDYNKLKFVLKIIKYQ